LLNGSDKQPPSKEITARHVADALAANRIALDILIHERAARRIEFRGLAYLVDIEERVGADELAFAMRRGRQLPARPCRFVRIDARASHVFVGCIGRVPGAVGPAVVSPEREERTKLDGHGRIAPFAPDTPARSLMVDELSLRVR
jgi:hypothetical protein